MEQQINSTSRVIDITNQQMTNAFVDAINEMSDTQINSEVILKKTLTDLTDAVDINVDISENINNEMKELTDETLKQNKIENDRYIIDSKKEHKSSLKTESLFTNFSSKISETLSDSKNALSNSIFSDILGKEIDTIKGIWSRNKRYFNTYIYTI